MPHFVIDCSESLLSTHDVADISEQVYNAAQSTGLFGDGANIQVRLNTFKESYMAGKKLETMHVFASILEGRTKEQKRDLSKSVITALAGLYPDVEIIGMDVIDLTKGVGFSKKKL